MTFEAERKFASVVTVRMAGWIPDMGKRLDIVLIMLSLTVHCHRPR